MAEDRVQTNCNVELATEIAEALASLQLGHGDKRIVVSAAILMFHCAAPVLQMAFRNLYKRLTDGQINLDDISKLYNIQPGDELLALMLGRGNDLPGIPE